MKPSLVMMLFTAIVICCIGNAIAETTSNHVNNIIAASQKNGGDKRGIDTLCKNTVLFAADTLYNNEVIFFGDTLIMDEPMHIKQQIEEIAAMDSVLSIDDCYLYVGDVGFEIVVCNSYVLELVSETHVDDPRMEQVVDYLNSLYGTTEETEPGNYWWRINGITGYLYNWVRLRPIPLDSEGTRLIFDGN